MIGKPTLIVHTTYFPVSGAAAPAPDPERAAAVRLGEDLYQLLTRAKADPLAWGAGIPVRVATAWDRIDVSEAESTLILPVLGARAYQDEPTKVAALSALKRWREERKKKAVRLVPVFASAVWRNVESELPTPLLTELYAADDARRDTLNEILLQLARMLANQDDRQDDFACQLFISHAKADIKATGNAAERIRSFVASQTTGKAFFDKVSVIPGEDLKTQLDLEAGRGVFLAVRGDLYASRSWCRRELLRAKQQRMPTLTVEVLSTGELRSATYAGNGPTVVWDRRAKEPEARVVTLAMVEAVRHLHFHAEGLRVIAASDLPGSAVLLSRPPELLDLAAVRGRTDRVLVLLHPDPPLPPFEASVLREADKRIRAVTPTTAFANVIGSAIQAPLDGWRVALSISGSPDAPEQGGADGATAEHVDDAITFLARALIGVGAQLAYGGDFRKDGYTRVLAGLVQLVGAYSDAATPRKQSLHGYVSATVDPEEAGDLDFSCHSMRGHPRALLPLTADGTPRPPAALYHSDMRRVMALETQARVVLGGKSQPRPHDPTGYTGRYPGVVEEAWRTLESGQPLYVAGGFGGGAALVVEALLHDQTPDGLNEAKWAGKDAWDSLVAALTGHPAVALLGLPPTQAALAAEIYRLGKPHLGSDSASLAWNGLTLEENRTLFYTRDPLTLTSLVLRGLITKSTFSAERKLRIELVEGDVTSATNLELIVFPTFRDVELDGAGAVLDAATGGAATLAHRERTPIPVGSRLLGADYLYAADLGEVTQSLQDVPAHARRAARETATTIRRHGFRRVGIITFFGNVSESLSVVVPAMVEELCSGDTGERDKVELTWFERDPMRAAILANLLSASKTPVVLNRRTTSLPEPLAPPPGRKRTSLTVQRNAQALDVALLLHHANGLVPMFRRELDDTERARLAGDATAPAPAAAELSARGRRIADLLFGDDAGRLLQALGDSELVIAHDESAAGIPYEALTWQKDGVAVTPASQGGIVRRLLVAGLAPERAMTRPPRARQLSVLVVIDPTGNLPGARQEGEALFAQLKKLPTVEPRVLRGGAATVAALRAAIGDPTLDVLHYCGHAFYNDSGREGSGLNCADGDLTLAGIRDVKSVPRLAFFNACQGGRVRGAPLKVSEPQAFAEFFLRAGVDAYVSTFWQVSDAGAATFAAIVYDALALGRELGEAVVTGRQALQKQQNSDWANYVLYGDAGFRLVQAGSALPGASSDQPSPLPEPYFRIDGTTLVASWVFPAKDAPPTFAVAVLEALTGNPVRMARAMRVERRDGWWATTSIVTWMVTVALREEPAAALELRPSAGASIHVPSAGAAPSARPAAPTTRSASAPTRAATPRDQAIALVALIEQQPDEGLALLQALQPSADPVELRALIRAEADGDATRAVWPFPTKTQVDAPALAAFSEAYPLASLTPAQASDTTFQTKEDWHKYAFTPGAIAFSKGDDVNTPLWPALQNPAAALTHELRDGEFPNSIEVALFSDNGNGLPASRAIAQQIVASRLPYAFHLGDVYYGGSKQEFDEYFEKPLRGMFDRTELFAVTGNHEMYANGEHFQKFLLDKAAQHPRQRQRAEMFRLRGPGFQILGVDTMFVGWNARRLRLQDYADEHVLAVLQTWLAERPNDLTILMTTNQPWDLGSRHLTRLYQSLRSTIGGRVDLWFWGNVHYAALYNPWGFEDAGSPVRRVVGSCIGHGGYPFYASKPGGDLPEHVTCRWLETQSRFWPEPRVRPDVGLNGWCRLKLERAAADWAVTLTFVDWLGRERLKAHLERKEGKSIELVSVMESVLEKVGGPISWVIR